MGNLGDYQRVVEIAKKVGGPRILAAIVAAGGFVLGVAGTKVVDKASKGAKRKKRATSGATEELFDVTSDGESGGLKLRAGDKYRVLAQDRDSILIEVLNNANNPHFVSRDFLQSVSDFENKSDIGD